MSTVGTYSFLPWLRQGLANQITTGIDDPAVLVRASIDVSLEARGETVEGGGQLTAPVSRSVGLFGPGDIVGIDRRAIVRTEPRHWATNFEPNYLPAIEFYDEDFPWRYTPSAPDARGRLRPWLALIVLSEDEFADSAGAPGRVLPAIEVTSLDAFPPAAEQWAWAHVHVNRDLSGSASEFFTKDMAAVMPRLTGLLAADPDLAYSRLVCPRRLTPNTAYHAFVLPAFEVGRLAGLGLDLAGVRATMSSWDPGPRPAPLVFPYYHRWFFRTGDNGDFETLVRLLVPKPVDRRVGRREMDVQEPGSGVPGVDRPEFGGILKLGGALRPPELDPPEPPDVHETWDADYPTPLQVELARLINLPDDFQAAGDPDPIVVPPLYGTWHAMTKRVLTERDGTAVQPEENWVSRLNLDPRFRAAAGIGTRVVQDQQEKLMDAAWDQIGDVLAAQRKIRAGQFGVLVSGIWYDRHLVPAIGVSRQRGLLLLAPLNKRLRVVAGPGGAAPATLHHAYDTSRLQSTMTSAAFRRVIRPRGRLVQSLPFTPEQPLDALLDRVEAGEVAAAPPKTAPAGAVTSDDLAAAVEPAGVPDWLRELLRRFPWLPLAVLLVALLVAAILALVLLPFSIVVAVIVGLAVAAAGVALMRLLQRWRRAIAAAELLAEGQTAASVDELPPAPGFVVAEPGEGVPPLGAGGDSTEAARLKEALRDAFAGQEAAEAAGRRPEWVNLDLGGIATAAIEAVRPSLTIPRRINAGITLPPRIVDALVPEPGRSFVEPMAYPVIDRPMYEPLRDLGAELFLPNINLIEPNSITLLRTHQRFIEAYLVGVNHEFARELLWREYPTDQRGSTFRQFWDVRGHLEPAGADADAVREKLRDIPPLHTWTPASQLGDHNHRQPPGEQKRDEFVLVIRGELLKRYPNAVIYAHRACWQRKRMTAEDAARTPCERSGTIDNTVERRLAPLTAAEELDPPSAKVLTPLYEAKIDPDISLFGFDLTETEARGKDGTNPDDDPGWFFVIKERPGEPRLGLDTDDEGVLQVWNDLSWPRVAPSPHGILTLTAAPAVMDVTSPGSADEKFAQFEDDRSIHWNRDTMTAAEVAYILFQAPVLVAVHGKEMLP